MAYRFLQEHDETGEGCITPVLHYLADPGFQASVGGVLGISQATVSRHI